MSQCFLTLIHSSLHFNFYQAKELVREQVSKCEDEGESKTKLTDLTEEEYQENDLSQFEGQEQEPIEWPL